ncbi:hypothetical protein [Streptomyces katsurahamanus]|uniref:Uncharacterized protein n=1 Tax=Streptomyces katsurahamanus TaxID=2577098 RepID=A0ABW9NSP6_9ACTN|nr:hypothetical protein [Streptomyces katsurahamanus]MQS36342.1 hypothetical protein [Streptomyces katsurahamanus]
MGTGGGGRAGQLLLLVALLFGIATMHTVGHPSDSPAPPPAASAQLPEALPGGGAVALTLSDGGHDRAAPVAFPAGPRELPEAPASAAALADNRHDQAAPVTFPAGPQELPDGSAHGTGHGTGPGSTGPGGHGMDPAMVCLAVLGVWGVLLLLAGPWSRRRGQSAHPALARLRFRLAPGPAPPAPRLLLAQLSVLRI